MAKRRRKSTNNVKRRDGEGVDSQEILEGMVASYAALDHGRIAVEATRFQEAERRHLVDEDVLTKDGC